MRTAFIVLAGLSAALLLLGPTISHAEKPKEELTEKEINVWMRGKTHLSQQVLQGLTEGDFEKIERGTLLMNVLSYFEGRENSENDDYKRQLRNFDSANRELLRMAKAKNIEGATLAYNQLTASCVYCHKRLRDAADGE